MLDKRLILVFAVVIASLGGAITWRITRPAEVVRKEVEIRSLVVLLNQPPALDKAAAEKAIHAEFGLEARVSGRLPLLTVEVEGHQLLVHVENGDYSLDSFEDFDLEHAGWIAVDDNTWQNRSVGDSYPMIARVLAALWEQSAIAIVHPQTKQWMMADDSTPKKLRDPDVINALFRREPGALSFLANEADPAMAAAREEARKRWPEFVKAFREREGKDFVVKAPITRGEVTEHIWIIVVFEDDKRVGGRLANEPFELAGLKLGSAVEVSLDVIDDWHFTHGGKSRGGFYKAIMEGRK